MKLATLICLASLTMPLAALPRTEKESIQQFRQAALSLSDFAKAYPDLKLRPGPRSKWNLNGTLGSASSRHYFSKHPKPPGFRYDSCLSYKEELKSPEASLRFTHYPYLTTQAATADFPLLIDGRGISVAERTQTFRKDPGYWKFRDFEKLGIWDQCWGGSAWGYRMRGGRLVINLLIRQGRNI